MGNWGLRIGIGVGRRSGALWFPTLSPGRQNAGSSTPLRFAQNERNDGARSVAEREKGSEFGAVVVFGGDGGV